MIEIEVFATKNPYMPNSIMARNFTCPEGEAVHVRLDPDRGFATEKNYDWLTIIYPSYFNQFSGPIEALDSRFTRPDWFYLPTSWLHMTFSADYSRQETGFAFEISCRGFQGSDGSPKKTTILTNENVMRKEHDQSG